MRGPLLEAEVRFGRSEGVEIPYFSINRARRNYRPKIESRCAAEIVIEGNCIEEADRTLKPS
jgi:hypothetical protein